MNDLNASGVVTDPAAGGQQQETGAGESQPGADTKKEINVPLHVVEAVRKELTDTKATKKDLENRLSQMEAMQSMTGGVVQQPAAQPSPDAQPAPAVDPFKDAGLEDDDLVDAATLKKIVATMQPTSKENTEPLKAEIAKLQLQVTDPDYEKTIRDYLPEMITANPMLRELITRAPNPLLSALTMARMSPKYIQDQQAKNSGQDKNAQPPTDPLAELQTIIDNATKPGSPGSMGGGGAVSGADRFRTMSDADFDKEVERVLGMGGAI